MTIRAPAWSPTQLSVADRVISCALRQNVASAEKPLGLVVVNMWILSYKEFRSRSVVRGMRARLKLLDYSHAYLERDRKELCVVRSVVRAAKR